MVERTRQNARSGLAAPAATLCLRCNCGTSASTRAGGATNSASAAWLTQISDRSERQGSSTESPSQFTGTRSKIHSTSAVVTVRIGRSLPGRNCSGHLSWKWLASLVQSCHSSTGPPPRSRAVRMYVRAACASVFLSGSARRAAVILGRRRRSPRRERDDRHRDGTEIRVRRPAVGRKDRDKFISGKNKQNAVKSMVVTDGEGRVLWYSQHGPQAARTSLTPAS